MIDKFHRRGDVQTEIPTELSGGSDVAQVQLLIGGIVAKSIGAGISLEIVESSRVDWPGVLRRLANILERNELVDALGKPVISGHDSVGRQLEAVNLALSDLSDGRISVVPLLRHSD